jgi:hypothetical protein
VLVEGGEFNLNMHATYEEIEFILQGGLQAVSPTGANPYVYTHIAPTNAKWYTQSYTMEYGYDIGTIGASGCLINKWGIKGSAKKQWEVSAGGFFKTYYNNAAIAIASSTNANPIEITTGTAHGLNTGMQVVIVDHETNTPANGTWTITYVDTTKFTLTGAVGTGVGGATGTVTKIQTPAIPDRTVEVILFPGTILKMEATGGTLGTTPFTNQLMSFGLDVTTGLVPVYGSDAKTPIAWTYDKLTPTLTLKLLWTAQAKAFLNSVLKAGQRAVCQLTNTSGAKIAELDFSGVMTDDPTFFPNEQSAKAVEFKLEGQYENTSIANDMKAIITNAVSAIP